MAITRVKHKLGGTLEEGMLDPPLGTAAGLAAGAFLQTANNLSELTPTAATARTNIGLGTVAVLNVKAGAPAPGIGAATEVPRFGDLGTVAVLNTKVGAPAVGAGAPTEVPRFGDLGSAAYLNSNEVVRNVTNPPVLYVRPSPSAGQFASIYDALESIKGQFFPVGAVQNIDVAGTFGSHPPFIIANDRVFIYASAATTITISPTGAGVTCVARDVTIKDINFNIATSCVAGIIANGGGILRLDNISVTRIGGTVAYAIVAAQGAAQINCINGGSVAGCDIGYHSVDGATLQLSGKSGGTTYTVSNCTSGLRTTLNGRIFSFTASGTLPLSLVISGTCSNGVMAETASAIELAGTVTANSGTVGYSATMNSIINGKGASPGTTSVATGGQIA